MSDQQLFAIQPDGLTEYVPCTYEGIKLGLRDAVMDFVRVSVEVGYYVDDEGMLNSQPLNVTASWFAARPIYGPVVVTAGDTDEEGNTLPGPEAAYKAMGKFAGIWAHVVQEATRVGQDLTVTADADTIPAPQVIGIEDFHTIDDVLRTWEEGK